ncbi:MAG: HAD family hydrolase, partial [Desulfocucumaceae bacterium]
MKKCGILFDFDDTLVETAVHFELSRERYARLMEDLNFPLDEVLLILDQMDIANVNKMGGFMKECFPRAMVQTYQHFCGRDSIDPDPEICRKVEEIGWWVFEQKPKPVPGAQEVLDHLSCSFDLFLATKGDPTIQWQRIDASGLKKFFKKIYVLKDKTIQEYRDIARFNQLDPERSWVIGNSIKSE